MSKSIQNIYEEHHSKSRPDNFSILEKERSFLLNKYIGKNKKVLDIGCRDGNLTRYFVDGNSVLGIDIDEISLNKASKNLGIRTMPVDLNGDWKILNGEKFNIIFAGEILEHLYFPEKILTHVVEFLDNNGDSLFIGSVPNAFSLKNRFRYMLGTKKYTPLSDPTHINQFSYVELKQLLSRYFRDVQVIGLGRYKKLSRLFPSLFSFDLFFVCKN